MCYVLNTKYKEQVQQISKLQIYRMDGDEVGFEGIVTNGGFKGRWVYTFSKIFQSIKLSKLRVGHKKLVISIQYAWTREN